MQSQITTKLSKKGNIDEVTREEAFIMKLDALKKSIATGATDIAKQYNALVLEHFDIFEKHELRFTLLSCVGENDLKNIPPEIVYEHKKNFENASQCPAIQALAENSETTLHEKTTTYTDSTVVKGLIEYAINDKKDD